MVLCLPGIGAYFQKSLADPGGLAVKSLLTNSPAQQCGKITVGDIVISVNGENVYGKKLAELAEHLLGPPGSEVMNRIQRFSLVVPRTAINRPNSMVELHAPTAQIIFTTLWFAAFWMLRKPLARRYDFAVLAFWRPPLLHICAIHVDDPARLE